MVKLTILGPITFTLASYLGAIDGLPDKWSNWGVVSILVWFLFYTIRFWIPAIETRNQAAMEIQRKDLLATRITENDAFLKTLRGIRRADNRSKKAINRILREVVDTQKQQMEMILQNAHTLERILKDKDTFEAEIVETLRKLHEEKRP